MTEDDHHAEPLSRLTLRLSPAAAEVLRTAAFAARTKPATLARVLVERALAAGALPPAAPPLPVDQPESVKNLLSILTRLTGNLRQVGDHADRLGQPFSRLSEAGGLIPRLSDRARELGLSARRGALSGDEAGAWVGRAGDAAEDLNSRLSRPLNEGGAVPPETWKAVFGALQAALLTNPA